MHTGTERTEIGIEASAVATFIRLDLLAALAGTAFVIVANGVFVRIGLIWLVMPPLLVLIGLLVLAGRHLAQGRLRRALGFATAGNWLVALVVAAMFPFLWPVMVLTALMPLVMATPHLVGRALAATIGAGAAMAGLIGAVGLLNDDAGVVPDINDTFELFLVAGALAAQIVPIILVVWQNNRLQRAALERATVLNVELDQARLDLIASRRRVVEAADQERSRIERDLHDGAQARLVALGIHLRLLEAQAETAAQREGIAALLAELEAAAEELRELSHGIYPPVLERRGLAEALRAVVRRSDGRVVARIDEVGRHHPAIESALYFACLEALTNAAKHATEASVEVTLQRDSRQGLRLEVRDDGPGFDPGSVAASQGMVNLADRVAVIGGRLTVDSNRERGTTISVVIPPATGPPS